MTFNFNNDFTVLFLSSAQTHNYKNTFTSNSFRKRYIILAIDHTLDIQIVNLIVSKRFQKLSAF